MDTTLAIFDAHFFAFVGVAALLVLSPGATMIVVADAAIEGGRRAALWTVAGIGSANLSMALAAAFGLAALVQRVPAMLRAMSIVGAVYLAWLGVRAVWRAARADVQVRGSASSTRRDPSTLLGVPGHGRREPVEGRPTVRLKAHPASSSSSLARFGRGLLTNYANPSVVIFYAVVVPQFITHGENFLSRYLLLGGTHVVMSVVWQGLVGLSVGMFAERMSRPGVRRAMDLAMGAALLIFAVKIALG